MSTDPSGNVVSPTFGGGTAIVEFEALTGFSNWFQGITLPYHFYVRKRASFPSIASYLKRRGYTTVALHPYSGLMYDRRPSYKSMGFENFTDRKEFSYTDRDRTAHYISDKSAYNELLQSLKDTESSEFALLVTMQNHTPYGIQYSKQNHQFTSTANVTNETNNAINDYLELIKTSDEALKYLVSELDKLDEKTVVVFWGDHLPGVYNSLPDDDIRKWETPFFVYANFEIAAEQTARNGDLGDISPNYISTESMSAIGLKAPAFYYLLDEVKRDDPTLVRRWPHETNEESEALKDYALIQYDVMSGEGYSLDTNFFG
jgi:phosphoglycerol transferase MdoB-like AlkP superfamily enzyme